MFELLIFTEIERDMHNMHIVIVLARPIGKCMMIYDDRIGESREHHCFKETVQKDGVVDIEDHCTAK